MDLRRRVDQVIKDKEAAVVWTAETGFQLVSPYYIQEDNVLPEEIIALLYFINRICEDNDFLDNILELHTKNEIQK